MVYVNTNVDLMNRLENQVMMKAGWIRMPEGQIVLFEKQSETFLSVGLWLADKASPVSSPFTLNHWTISNKIQTFIIIELKQGCWIIDRMCYFFQQDISCGSVVTTSHNLLIYQDFFYISTQLIIPALSLIPNNSTTDWTKQSYLYIWIDWV